MTDESKSMYWACHRSRTNILQASVDWAESEEHPMPEGIGPLVKNATDALKALEKRVSEEA